MVLRSNSKSRKVSRDKCNFYKNEEENANYRINIAKDQKADYLLRIELNSNSDPLEKGYTIFTQPNDSLIDLSNEIAQNLMQINYSEFKGLFTIPDYLSYIFSPKGIRVMLFNSSN